MPADPLAAPPTDPPTDPATGVPRQTFEAFDADRHDRSSFTCTEPTLETYLRERARKDHQNRVRSVFALSLDGVRVSGFYTLSSSAVKLSDLPANPQKPLPQYQCVPVMPLGRLAVSGAQGNQASIRGNRLPVRVTLAADFFIKLSADLETKVNLRPSGVFRSERTRR